MKGDLPDVPHTPPRRLAPLMRLGEGDREILGDEQLRALLAQELGQPVQFDLAGYEAEKVWRLRATASASGLLLKSLGDLFRGARPSVELLRATKDYAKACWNHPDSVLPPVVAKGLYFLSIAVALSRCRVQISHLPESALRAGLAESRDAAWMDDALRPVFDEALRVLGEGKGQDDA